MGVLIACELLRRGCRVVMWDNKASRCQCLQILVRSILSSYCRIDALAIDSLMKLLYTASDLAEIASSWLQCHHRSSSRSFADQETGLHQHH